MNKIKMKVKMKIIYFLCLDMVDMRALSIYTIVSMKLKTNFIYISGHVMVLPNRWVAR